MRNRYTIEGDVVKIEMRRRKREPVYALVDKRDLEQLLKFDIRWHGLYVPRLDSYYATAQVEIGGKLTSILLHRWLMDPPSDLYVDHISHDILNNRRSNLRLATPGENLQNKQKAARNNKTSGVLNVSWKENVKKWRARIFLKGKEIFLGHFDSVEEAKVAVDSARATYFPFSKEAARG